MPKGYGDLAKKDVKFLFDSEGNCTLTCCTGEEPFELLGIDDKTSMEDVMMHIAIHVAEYHPERKNH